MTRANQPHTRRRIPKLSYTESQCIGFFASYRDPVTGTSRRKRFGMIEEQAARVLYSRWLAEHMAQPAPSRGRPIELRGLVEPAASQDLPPSTASPPRKGVPPDRPASLLVVADSLIKHEQARSRPDDAPKRRGTICERAFLDRKSHILHFLRFLNDRHGQGSPSCMTLADLQMRDVEVFNLELVRAGYSASQVAKRMQIVKAIINRSGRPEFGLQVLPWN